MNILVADSNGCIYLPVIKMTQQVTGQVSLHSSACVYVSVCVYVKAMTGSVLIQ